MENQISQNHNNEELNLIDKQKDIEENRLIDDKPVIQESKKKINVQSPKYMYLEGLRGIGALIVYFHHFIVIFHPYFLYGKPKDPVKYQDQGGDPPYWLKIATTTPLHIFLNGPFWVVLFYIISGFVLPLSWFKSRRHSSIFGGAFRRYLRLMLPVLGILPIYYFVAQMDISVQEKTFVKVKPKGFLELILDCLFGTWFGNQDYSCVTWTLGVELWASFFVFILAETIVNYRQRWVLYALIFLFLLIPRVIEEEFKAVNYQFTQKNNNSKIDFNLRQFMPHFFLGVLFCDLETAEGGSYFDPVRKLSIWWKIPLNTLLLFLFISYGSVIPKLTCKDREPEDCERYYNIITFNYKIRWYWSASIGAISGFFLTMTSQWFQWILETVPFLFLGRISYTIYLIHILIVQWPQMELASHFRDQGVSYGESEIYVFLIFTPVLFLISWILEIVLDTPSKNFSHNLDLFARIDLKNVNKEDQNESKCWKFIKNQWIIWGLLIYLTLILTVTETYGAVNGNKERIHSSAIKYMNFRD